MGLTIWTSKIHKENKVITIITTIIAVIVSIVIYKVLNKKIRILQEENKKYDFRIRSAYCKFGKTFEKFVPFTKDFPSDKEKAVFLGMPIDFISFDDDSIKFIEVKTGYSKLSPKQEHIKKLVEDKKVEFKELRY